MIKLILAILAIVFFIMAGVNVPKFNWTAFGFACVTAAILLPI